MGTEVLLPPQDLLADSLRPAMFHRRRIFRGKENLTHSIVNRSPIHNTVRRKTDKKRSKFTEKLTHGGASETRGKDDGLVMGKVTLPRRGEFVDSFASKIEGGISNRRSPNRKPIDDMAVLGTNRFGPDSPVLLSDQIMLSLHDAYAGSAFYFSPSPRSLPLPSFFNKPFDNPATRDLRLLLRLDL